MPPEREFRRSSATARPTSRAASARCCWRRPATAACATSAGSAPASRWREMKQPARPSRRAAGPRQPTGRAAARGEAQGHRLGAAGADRRGRVRQPHRRRHPAPRGLQGAAAATRPTNADVRPRRRPVERKRYVTDADLAAIWVTNPDRPMFGEGGPSKLELALYYARVGDWLLPELIHRPVSLVRCPTGKVEDSFFQRHALAGMPDGVKTIPLQGGQGGDRRVSLPRGRARAALARPVRRGRVPQLGLPGRQAGAPRSHRVRPRPGRGPALAPGGRRRLRGARGARGARPRAVPQDHRRQGPARRRAARGAARAGSRSRRFCEGFARADGRRARRAASPPTCPRPSAAGGSISTICATSGVPPRSRPIRCARGPGVPVSTPLGWDELTEVDDPADLNYATVPERLAAGTGRSLGRDRAVGPRADQSTIERKLAGTC